jgi:hypothetical protein
MTEFEFMGRIISINGEGSEDSPFVLTGTGPNPALAAELETFIVGRIFGDQAWHLQSTRIESGLNNESLAVITVRFFSTADEILQTDIWFNVTEAFSQ